MKKPSMSDADTQKVLSKFGIKDSLVLLGVRGHFKSEASPDFNDRGIYDDAIFLMVDHLHIAFNGNTDPSRYRPGVASLSPGLWHYKIGTHGLGKPLPQRYKALVQASPVSVTRDGKMNDYGYLGVNIHKGGFKSTGSEGCQTIYPDQWDDFIKCVEDEMNQREMKTIKYLLIEA